MRPLRLILLRQAAAGLARKPMRLRLRSWLPVPDRYFVLGQTDAGRELFLVFTLRDELIRVISAREMSRKERKVYRSHG